jgi:hypothetical protein
VYLLTGALPNRSILFKDQSHFDALALVPSLNTASDSDPSDRQIVRELAMMTLGNDNDEVVETVLSGARGGADEGAMRENDAVVRALVLLTSMPEYQLC